MCGYADVQMKKYLNMINNPCAEIICTFTHLHIRTLNYLYL